MKIAWLLVWTWASSNVAAQLRFATEESLDEIQEDETYKLTSLQLETSPGVPLINGRATWSQTYYQLLISCDHGTLQLDQEIEHSLVDTMFLCVSRNGNLQQGRSIGVITTAREAQQILSSIVYQPDTNYHSIWYGVTDPLCTTGYVSNEIVRMKLSPVNGDLPDASDDSCIPVDLGGSSVFETSNTHEKKISVSSVNDPPTVEIQPRRNLSVVSGGSCIGLYGFKLGDAEADAIENGSKTMIPILTLQLSVKFGKLRVNRRSALQSGIHVIGNGNTTRGATLAWKNPDLFDSALTMKGAISDLNEFLSEVEYCSSTDFNVVVPDTLSVTLSDNGFCGSLAMESLSASLAVPVRILPTFDLGELLFTKTSITLTKHLAAVPLTYTPGTSDEMEYMFELKYHDGMLLGIDHQAGTRYGKPDMESRDTSKISTTMLIPTSGLVVRFWGDKLEPTSFKFAREVCTTQEVCHQVESTALYEGASDEEIIAAAQKLTLDSESVADLQVIRYPVSRLWLIWNIPDTFSQEALVSTRSRVSAQTVKRRFRLLGNSEHIAAQMKTLKIYSLMGGVWSYNNLNVTISPLDKEIFHAQGTLSAQLDIFASPILENVELLHPPVWSMDESMEGRLEAIMLSYPSTYVTSSALRWTVRSTLGSIWWDPSSVSPAVVSSQVSEKELELQGNLVDLNAALSSIRIDESATPLSKTLLRSSLENPGNETQIAIDTITMVLETLDISTIVTSGTIQARVSRMIKKLGIRLPLSYVQVDLNQTLTIDGVGLDGYAHELNLSVSCTKGTINLLHKQPAPTLLNPPFKPVNSTMKISGYFLTLEEILQNSHLVYSPLADATGYDRLVFTIESIDDQAIEVLPIVINSPVSPPSLTLPTSPIYSFENEYVPVVGVVLNIANVQEQGVTSREITVDIASRSGQVELMTDGGDHNPQHNAGVRIQGDSENINAALKELRYKPPVTGTPNEDEILFSTSWAAESGSVPSTATFVVSVKIIRRSPTISVLLDGKIVGGSSVATITMNSLVSFESLFIQVDDQWNQCNQASTTTTGISGASCSVTIHLSLFAGHGIISNHSNSLSQEREQDSPLSSVRFSGSLTHANVFLQQQVYIPDDKFFGFDHVVITIKHSTSAADAKGVTAEDTILLPVFVAPGCEAPQLFWADSGTDTMSFSSSSRIPFTLPEILFVREGLEKGLCQDDIVFRVTVQADKGFVTLKSSASTTLLDDHRSLALEGRIWDLNLAFKSVEYQFEIHRETQIPVMASIDVRVEGKTRQKKDSFAEVSSAQLRLKFTGDTQLPDLLAKVTIQGSEDTDMLIGDAINLNALMDFRSDSVITISVSNGVVYASANGVNFKANSEQQIDTNDIRHLRSVMTNLRYIPNPNFNGIEEIDFGMGNQHSILYIYVEANNDPPELMFNSEEMKDWYNYPRMFIPSVQLNDPDENQMFQVDIRVDNGSLFLDQASSSTFDGVTMELSSTSSRLRMISRLSRLNIVLLQRLIEIIPNNCMKEGIMRMSCAASMELCVDDGFITVCDELKLPEQDLFYYVTVPVWAKSLNVSAGSSLNISSAFEIHQKFDVMYDLILRIHSSSGIICIDVPNCGGLRGVGRTGQLQQSTITVYASDVACLNKALESLELQTACGVNGTIAIQLELFSDNMRLMTSQNISVKVTDIRLPKQMRSLRTTDDEPWKVRFGSYTNLTSLLNVSIVADSDNAHDNEADDEILELNVSCSNCQWQYQAYVSRVSYEFAQIPSSRLRFLGLSDSLNLVLATLELAITSTSNSNAEIIHFQLAPVVPKSVRRTEPIWMDSTNVSIPFTIEPSSLLWESKQTSFIVQSPNFTASLSGLELKGKEENISLNLTIRFECTLGEATVSMKPTFLEHSCSSGESSVSITMERSHVTEVISSTLVKVTPKARESRVELRLYAFESTEDIPRDSASIELHFRSLRQLPMATLAPDNISAVLHVNEEDVRSVGAVLVVRGDRNDPTWFRMKVSVAHGRLTIPNNVCCVDIRETDNENELDVVGSALALKDALAATQFQGDKQYVGKGSLDVVIFHFSSGQASVLFSIPIEVAGVHEPTITNQSRADSPSSDVIAEGTTIAFENVEADIDLWGDFEDFASLKVCESSDLANNLAVVHRENNVDFKAVSTIPLIHIEGSIEGPLSSKHWEVISLALEIGKSCNIPGIFIGDGSGESIVSDDDLILEISAGIGSVFLTGWDGLQMSKGQDSTLTAMGKIDRLNAALLTLRYQCSRPCSHYDEIRLRVTNPIVRPPASHQRTIRIDQVDVIPVPRVATSVSLYYSTEDAAFQFSALTLNFAESAGNGSKAVNNAQAAYEEDAPIYRLKIRVSYGTMFIITTDSFTEDEQQARKRASNHLELEGTVTNLERDLNRLVYFAPQNWNEEQFPGGHIVEWQFVVSYEDKSVESFADLVVMSRIDAPVISVPQALEDPFRYMSDYLSILRLECLPLVCDEDTPMILDGLSVRAADTTPNQSSRHDLLLASFSVSHGIISFGDTWRTNCIRQFVGAQSWKHVSFNANADCINRVLTGMVYVGEPNFSGTDQLKLRVEYARESGGAFDEVIIPIVVVELNDAPYIDVNSVFYEVEEDIPLVIDNLRLRDPDTLDISLRVILDARHGQLALLKPNGVKVTSELVESVSRLTLEGTMRNLDIAIASVVYTSAQDWNSLQFQPDGEMNGFDTITIHSTDFSTFNGSSVSVLFIYVEPTTDPVLIYIPSNAATSIYAADPPGTLRGDEDTWINVKGLTFSSADDTSRTTLVVSLSVANGILSLPSIGGITFVEGTADGSNMLTLQGTFATANACMVGLRYLPTKDFFGQDSLAVTANAIDEYTQQQTPLSSIHVAITVNAVNDAPVWNIGSSVVREIQQGQAASILGIFFYDVDVATMNCSVDSCVMDLTVEASDGLAVLPAQSSPQFSNDMTTKKAAYTVVSGTPDELNMLLSYMTFELADTEFYRADNPGHTDIKLQLTVDDRGTFGWGGPQISTTTVMFNPVLWSQYDFAVLAPEGVLTLDEDTTYTFDGNLQLVDPDSARSFHNLLELTITCFSGTFALSSRVTGLQVLRNNSDEGIVIRGFFAQLNAALNGSSYIPEANWYGSEELSLSVTELNRLENSKERAVASIFLFIVAVCDVSRWAPLASIPHTMKEDEYLLIDTLSLTNPDDDEREVLVTISVKHGGVMLSITSGLLIHEAVSSTSEESLVAQHATSEQIFFRSRLFFKDLVFLGRVSDVNAALKGMVFKPWLDYNSDGWPVDEIVLGATSACSSTESGSSSVSRASQVTILIAVDAVNDPPMLISQHFQRVSPSYSLSNLELASSIEAVEDSPRRLESTELHDPDFELSGGDLRLLVNISCIHCTITSKYLSLSSETQPSDDLIVVTRNWQNDEGVQLVVHGNLPSLNSGLMNQLIFRGVNNFNGVAYVLVEISDLGNYGEGGEQRSVFVLGVQVKAVNDKPQIFLPKYQLLEPILKLDENSSVLIQGAPALSEIAVLAQRQYSEWNVDSIRSITLQDVEAMQNTQDLTVSLNCSKGWLSLGQQCDGVAVNLDGTPDNKKAAVLTLRGSLSALNCAVGKVTYHSKPQESGWDAIYVTLSQGLVPTPNIVDDTERDSSYTVSKRMLVEIHAINDPPSISMATTFYAPVGRWVALTGIEITDPDSTDGILYVSVTVRIGRIRVTLPPRVNSGGPTLIHPTVAGDISQTLEFATTTEQALKIFGALEYNCDESNSQRDYLTIQVDDNGFTGSRGPQVAIMTAKIIVMSEANV